MITKTLTAKSHGIDGVALTGLSGDLASSGAETVFENATPREMQTIRTAVALPAEQSPGGIVLEKIVQQIHNRSEQERRRLLEEENDAAEQPASRLLEEPSPEGTDDDRAHTEKGMR